MMKHDDGIHNANVVASGKGGGMRPLMGTTYEGRDPTLLGRMLPFVDFIEITPDTIAEVKNDEIVFHGPTLAELKAIGSQAKIILHGVGLSIGSHEGYSERYLRMIDDLVEELDVAWHSEHLGYTTVDGDALGTMLTLPRTEQALDMICERVNAIQERYPLPFLLENVVNLLPEFDADYSHSEFLNAVVERTGCGLILDVYNLECDANNNSLDIPSFLNELNMNSVREIHLANGVEHRGFWLDVHSRITRESTIALAEEVVARAERVEVVTYELLREAVPILGHDAIVDELARLRSRFVK